MADGLATHFEPELARLDELHRRRVLSQLQSPILQERIEASVLLQRMKSERAAGAESV